ncbi:hypothetical protein ACFFK0_22600 [Paenibacillus chartarius]|uniref:Glycosyltransferase RgtA/B/C/D-like domain-containing protein n=1 Tax=Paenibacillus chartarius TaxID=747481 RepID=A0ABV6DRA4_9BACL
MYDSFWNQSYHLFHFFLAMFLLLYLWPKLIFPQYTKDRLEQTIANYLLMAFLMLAVSFFLISVRLYEFMSVAGVLALIAYHVYVRRRRAQRLSAGEEDNRLVQWLFDYAEGLIHLKSSIVPFLIRKTRQLGSAAKSFAASGLTFYSFLLMAVIFGIAAYIRFYDAVHSPVPTMSDGWVALKWIKYAERQTLYPDGIYPAGYQVFLATIRKFADVDALYVLKYIGPLNSMLIMLGYYFTITRWTSSKAAALIAMTVYGVLSELFFHVNYARQASSMSQEFGMAFVFFTLYFYVQYMRTGSRVTLWAGMAGTAAVGLAHSIPFVWIGMGMGWLLALHFLLTRGKEWRRDVHLALAGVICVVIAITPIALAYAFRVTVYEGVTEFVSSEKNTYQLPELVPMDYAALASIVLLFLYACVKKTAGKLDRLPELFIALFVLSTFMLFYFGVYTEREVLIVRSRDLWYTSIPLIIGMGAYVLFRLLGRIRIRQAIEAGAATAVLAGSVFIAPPKPIIPYKLESKTTVEQYLRITRLYATKSYLIVSPRIQMFPLTFGTLGKGSHMYLETGSPSLLNDFDPTKPPLTRYGQEEHADVAADIFIFKEKQIFQVSQDEEIYRLEAPKYKRYVGEYKNLDAWIETAKASLPPENITTFYEDDNLIIYHLYRPENKLDREREVRKIWS